MSLLTIIQTAAQRLAIPEITAVVSSSNAQVLQLWNLANKEGQELTSRNDWRRLNKQFTFQTVDQEAQTNAIPGDYDHYCIDSMYNRTSIRKVVGPLSPADWQAEKAFPVYTAINPAFRIRGADLLLTPDPDNGSTIAYEYISNQWVLAADDTTYKTSFTADTDNSLLNEDIVTDGVVWRFKSAKGFDYSEEFSAYEIRVGMLMARDGAGKPRLNLKYGMGRRAFYPANISEGNWPG